MMDDDSRERAKERLIAYLAIGVLAALLLVAWTHTRRAQAAVRELQETVALMDTRQARADILIRQQADSNALLQADIDRLAAIKPTERIVVQPCYEGKTPVFSRDKQFKAK